MALDSFFDTNVVFNYSNFVEGQSSPITQKCYMYILEKKGKFVICGAVIKELTNISLKRAQIHKYILIKIKDSTYSLEAIVPPKDLPFAKKLYENYKDKNPEEVSKEFATERDLSDMKIEQFLKTKIDEKVVSITQIDNELTKKINDIIDNYADSKILASALDYQQDREIFLIVTADKKDLSPNGYEYLKEHFKINHPKEKCIFPELKNLFFEK